MLILKFYPQKQMEGCPRGKPLFCTQGPPSPCTLPTPLVPLLWLSLLDLASSNGTQIWLPCESKQKLPWGSSCSLIYIPPAKGQGCRSQRQPVKLSTVCPYLPAQCFPASEQASSHFPDTADGNRCTCHKREKFKVKSETSTKSFAGEYTRGHQAHKEGRRHRDSDHQCNLWNLGKE